jgi:hypothetical protein
LEPGWDSERVWSGEDDWEPFVSADPSSDYVYQMTTRFSHLESAVVFRSSSDNGASWGQDRILGPVNEWQADPQVAVANDGTIYALWLDGPDYRTKLVKSSDHGESWTTPLDVAPRLQWTDHAWLVISPDGRDVYIALNQDESFMVTSHDYGKSFKDPVRTSYSRGRWWMHAAGAMAPNGDVYYVVIDYPLDFRGPTDIYIMSSQDGGSSWESRLLDTSHPPPDCDWASGCYYGFLSSSAGIAIDESGRIMVAYNAGYVAYEPHQIWTTTSTDGQNWTTAVQCSHENAEAGNAFPAIGAGPTTGDFRVVWQGNENGNVNGWNTWYRRTTDGGASWEPIVRVSDRIGGAPYKNRTGYEFPYGDYLGLSVDSDGTDHVIWGEALSYDGPGGTWYTRSHQAASQPFSPAPMAGGGSAVEHQPSIGISRIYPNPFNPRTTIVYLVSSRQSVVLGIYDLLGREVATLVNEVKSPGTYTVSWDATGQPSGVYFYRLTTDSFVSTRKLVLAK